MNIIELKLPAIPQGVTAEFHQYYVELHKNLKRIEEAINKVGGK